MLKTAFKTLRRNPIGLMGLIIVLLVVLMAIVAPLISPYTPTSQLGRRLSLPSAKFLLGTDEFGRDILSRIIYGTRISLYVGVISVGLALLIGGLIGLLSGFYGGTLDNVLMRLVDIVFSIPSLILAIVIAGLLGPSLRNAMIAIGIVYAPTYARLVRAGVLEIKNLPYIEAATVVGGTTWHTITRHLLPNITPLLIVQTSLLLSTAILSEASLSFWDWARSRPTRRGARCLAAGASLWSSHPGSPSRQGSRS